MIGEKVPRIKVADGSSWPRPALDSDEHSGVGWVLRYGEPTRADLLEAAAIIDAYGYLVAESTREKRDLVCRDVRAALRSLSPGHPRAACDCASCVAGDDQWCCRGCHDIARACSHD